MSVRPGPKGKFTPSETAQIARAIAAGATDEQIAAIYGVHRTTVGRLRHRLASGYAPEPENALLALMRREYSAEEREQWFRENLPDDQ